MIHYEEDEKDRRNLSCGCKTIAMAGCGNSVPKNTVNSVDDLEGKKIGVQLGTTGDIYASDYEGDDAEPRSSVTTREPMRFRR